MHTTHLLYLHGFRSSPQSPKAQKMAALVRRHHPGVTWWCPQLPPSPYQAMALLHDGLTAWPQNTMAVVGSSLGGFYAALLAERYGCKTVLLNPAVDPARDLARIIAEQSSWQDPEDQFFLTPHFIDELRALQQRPPPALACALAIIAKGDEVLDWREMAAHYASARQCLLEGGDHALSDFESHLPLILDFLALT